MLKAIANTCLATFIAGAHASDAHFQCTQTAHAQVKPNRVNSYDVEMRLDSNAGRVILKGRAVIMQTLSLPITPRVDPTGRLRFHAQMSDPQVIVSYSDGELSYVDLDYLTRDNRRVISAWIADCRSV
ncbi:hypothetical protein GH975_06290 [Litorivicinus lipolyticus]|uniref:Uncharacterized protein n=1 Tax=Litorivicinus lipolyticus TaxID=418701 RepID=A0A5Q2QAX2_9GAMM|nr:hypothetical protein [Litorivicinus lipolyticus]QGG80204.1 hypothetical protein GH975_06290 [Litorivicinus lipolyticus]